HRGARRRGGETGQAADAAHRRGGPVRAQGRAGRDPAGAEGSSHGRDPYLSGPRPRLRPSGRRALQRGRRHAGRRPLPAVLRQAPWVSGMRAIQFETTGGPEVLKLVDIPAPEPKPGQVRVRHEAIGINFIDTYHRTGLYPVKLPCTPGGEAAGVVEAVGEGVTRLKVGDRVAYSGGFGAYAEANVVAANRAVKVPEGVDTRTAAASLLKGMTVEALLRRTYPVKAGETILVHAAAGG